MATQSGIRLELQRGQSQPQQSNDECKQKNADTDGMRLVVSPGGSGGDMLPSPATTPNGASLSPSTTTESVSTTATRTTEGGRATLGEVDKKGATTGGMLAVVESLTSMSTSTVSVRSCEGGISEVGEDESDGNHPCSSLHHAHSLGLPHSLHEEEGEDEDDQDLLTLNDHIHSLRHQLHQAQHRNQSLRQQLTSLHRTLLTTQRALHHETTHRAQLDAEYESLSATLFEQANELVRVERVKRGESEKRVEWLTERLREKEGVIEHLSEAMGELRKKFEALER